MEFGWINAAGGVIVTLMLVPNVIYAVRNPVWENRFECRTMNVLEQFGRYASMALMIFPLGVWRFGFPSVEAMLIYLLGNGILLACYWACWGLYFQKISRRRAIALAVIPTCIFALSGLTLRHWLLFLSAVIFGVGHVYVTLKNQDM